MKHLYFISIACLFSVGLGAQTLTQTQMPLPGDEFPGIYADNDYNPGAAGENVTWDFSDFVGTEESFKYETVTNDPVFTDAKQKLALENAGQLYFKNGTSEYLLTGMYSSFNGENIAVPYSDPQILFKFPFNYQDTLRDVAKATFKPAVSPVNVYRTVTSVTIADGKGKLITPDMTYNNVLRLKVTSSIKDSSNLPVVGAKILTSGMEEYYFFDDKYRHQVVYMARVQQAGKPSTDLVFYFKNSVLARAEAQPAEAANIVFPNPANGELFIKSEAGEGKVSLFNTLGSQVLQTELKAGVNSVDISSLPEGIYYYELRNGKNTPATGRVVVN